MYGKSTMIVTIVDTANGSGMPIQSVINNPIIRRRFATDSSSTQLLAHCRHGPVWRGKLCGQTSRLSHATGGIVFERLGIGVLHSHAGGLRELRIHCLLRLLSAAAAQCLANCWCSRVERHSVLHHNQFRRFGDWAFISEDACRPAGLLCCRLPFFRNTLLSNLLCSAILFGGLIVAENRFVTLREGVAAA
jgi:hypothetical protein